MKTFKEFLRAFCWLFTVSTIIDSILKTLDTGATFKPVGGSILSATVFGLLWILVFNARQKENNQLDENKLDT